MVQVRSNLQLGFIGLGNMGSRLARRLIGHGHQVSLFDIDPSAMRPLVRLGGNAARSAMDVASRAHIVCTCLPSLDAIREAALGEKGICKGERVKIHVDMSTTNSKFARDLAVQMARHQIRMLDSPVSGGIQGAANGTLAVIVSGNTAAFRQARPVLDILGRVFYVGAKPGCAQTLKLINNLLATAGMAIACEGFVMGVKAGLDPDAMLAVINSGTGRNNATVNKFPRSVLPRTFDYGSNLEIPYKDICLCMKEAEELGVTMWVGNAVKQLLGYGVHQGGAKQDATRLITHLEKWAGVKVIGKAAKTRRRKSISIDTSRADHS